MTFAAYSIFGEFRWMSSRKVTTQAAHSGFSELYNYKEIFHFLLEMCVLLKVVLLRFVTLMLHVR